MGDIKWDFQSWAAEHATLEAQKSEDWIPISGAFPVLDRSDEDAHTTIYKFCRRAGRSLPEHGPTDRIGAEVEAEHHFGAFAHTFPRRPNAKRLY